MSRKMLINASDPEEIRVALVEGSILEEYYVERMSVESCLGNIYKGRVTNVEPSIGAAFVEFGGPRHGFLHVSDIMDRALPEPAPPPAEVEEEPTETEDRPDEDVAADAAADVVEEDPGATESEVSDELADEAALHADEDEVAAEVSEEEGIDPDPGDASAEIAAEADIADDEPADGESDDIADADEAEVVDEADEAMVDEEPVRPTGRRRSRRGRRRGRGKPDDAEASESAAGSSSNGPTSNGKESGPRDSGGKDARRKNRSILDYVKKGDEIIVQVTKDGIGTKGPTLTTYLSMPGRYLVLMPGHDRRGVSRKIDDGKERDRLKKVLGQLDVRDNLGFIVRTAGVGQTKRALQKDYDYLAELWDSIDADARGNKAPHRLFQETDLISRTIRDIYRPDMGDIIVDDEDVARRTREFLSTVMPRAAKNVKLYTGERPLFTAYGIEEEIGQLFLHRVELKSGGSLIIEQTEALVAIDVNSGRFREEEDLEETAYKINLEAADAIARQLRLRDLGGVIVLDFIDMKSEKRRKAIERAFRASLKDDRARTKVARMSMFGTIEMTRQRVRPSLRQSIFKRCPTCRGVGFVATPETLQLNLVRQMKLMLARKNKGLEVWVNHENAEYLVNEKRDRLLELEAASTKAVRVRIEPELRDDEFRIVQIEK